MKLAEVAKQLFFIVGCPRSGTTLLQSMLASHADVTIPEETGFYTLIYPRYSASLGEIAEVETFEQALEKALNFYRIKDLNLDPNIIKLKCQEQPRSWETIFLAILATYAEQYRAKRIGEKSPRHFQYLGTLTDRFPKAKFIHIVRDPRAVVLSLMKAPFGSDRIANSCNLWQQAIAVHREYGSKLGEKRYFTVRYEDLIYHSQNTLESLCNFLDLDYQPEMLQFHRREQLGFNKKYLEHMSNTLNPLFTSSIDKWQKELSPAQIGIIQTVLQEEMNLLGYEAIKVNSLLPKLQYRFDLFQESWEHKSNKIKQMIGVK